MIVGIIGCGLIGRKRAVALCNDDTLGYCYDSNIEVGKRFALDFDCELCYSSEDLIEKKNVDIIIISVINKYVKDIAILALKNNKHVLIEKPMGKNIDESIIINSHINNSIVKVGFNLRFHPAIIKSKDKINNKEIGKILFMRVHYGHGSRVGMEKEWRASRDLCGGGELLDQGVHIVDLCRYFLEKDDIEKVYGKVSTKFWNIEVEDNSFVHLVSYSGVDIQMVVSWTTWKNTFSFEIYGDKGYLKMNGLGGSYGEESLETGIRPDGGGIPTITKELFDTDDSWIKEWKEFKNSIIENKNPNGNAEDGMIANLIIHSIYESSIKNKEIYLQ